jgi:NAD(P)-dependent dehydrogenase (short-subunit alcohol dehydrogenase family)
VFTLVAEEAMKIIIITGSTTGIGLGLAQALLARGCAVVINGRNPAKVNDTVSALAAEFGADRVLGVAGDVRCYEQMQQVWQMAWQRFGRIDVWINNAGTISPQVPFTQQTPDQIKAVVDTDLTGMLYGAHVALQGMLQQGYGQIYFTEGFGHDGFNRNGMAVYGSTKRAVSYFTTALLAELKTSSVQIGTLGPGIVLTDLLRQSYRDGSLANQRSAELLFRFMADDCVVVCNWLAERLLNNRRNGRRIAWLGLARMVHHVIAGFFRKPVAL